MRAWLVTWCLVGRAVLQARHRAGSGPARLPGPVLDSLDRMHELLADEPALGAHVARLESEVFLTLRVTVRTWTRVCRAIEDLAVTDRDFEAELTRAWRRLDAADTRSGHPLERALGTMAASPGADLIGTGSGDPHRPGHPVPARGRGRDLIGAPR